MSDQDRRPSSDDFDARLRAAQARDAASRKRRSRLSGSRDGSAGQGIGMALRIGTELVAGLAVGVAIGLLLDWWLGTKPLFLILFFILGAAAGIVNVFRTVSGLGHAVGYKPAPGKKDDGRGDQTG